MENQKLIQMTAKLYDARDTLKSLLGDRFWDRLPGWQEAIRDIAAKQGWTDAESFVALMKGEKDNAMHQMWLMAAFVEMVEPSKGR